jgi:hypothetical protein
MSNAKRSERRSQLRRVSLIAQLPRLDPIIGLALARCLGLPWCMMTAMKNLRRLLPLAYPSKRAEFCSAQPAHDVLGSK